jgi:putative methylase
MKLRRLEMLLEKVSGFEKPSPEREQYQTPAPLAARLLYTAFLAGDIAGLRILDLGSGTGILGIGAALLGAGEIFGVEIDTEANRVASENALNLGAGFHIITADLTDPTAYERIPKADTVLMNPPFGAQTEHADRPFIDMAISKADIVYGVFNKGSEQFIRHYTAGRAEITQVITADCTIPRMFFFHTDARRDIPVEIVRLRRIQ